MVSNLKIYETHRIYDQAWSVELASENGVSKFVMLAAKTSMKKLVKSLNPFFQRSMFRVFNS